MKEISLLTFLSVKDKFKTKVGYFDLYGLDFLVDEDMKASFISFKLFSTFFWRTYLHLETIINFKTSIIALKIYINKCGTLNVV